MPLFVERRAKHNGGVLARGLVDVVFLQTHSEIIRMVRMSFTEALSESAAVSQDAETTGHRTGNHELELEVELTLTGTRALLGSLITLPPNRWERYHVGINDHQ